MTGEYVPASTRVLGFTSQPLQATEAGHQRDVRTVYYDAGWNPILSAQGLVRSPPEGYEFIVDRSRVSYTVQKMAKIETFSRVVSWVERVLPLFLTNSYLQRFAHRPPHAITYCERRVGFRDGPWILDMACEMPYLLARHEHHFRLFRKVIQKRIYSPQLKAVIFWVNAGRRAFSSCFPSKSIAEKLVVVPWAVTKKEFTKQFNDDSVKLLFVNSANVNTPFHFEVKGGRVLIEAFQRLVRKYTNLELVIRSKVPADVFSKISKLKNVKVISQPVPWSTLEHEWKTADIFVQPTYITPASVFLDAMSYELPIETTDAWGNPDFIDGGRTGFLVPKSQVRYYGPDYLIHFSSAAFKKAVETVDNLTVGGVVDKLSILIEDSRLRRWMGRNSRHEVESGKFSITKRNLILRGILDSATT